MNDLATRVHRLVQTELGVAPERLAPHSRLAELGDSLDWLSLLGAVEAEFGIAISDEQERSLATVADLVVLLQQTALAPT